MEIKRFYLEAGEPLAIGAVISVSGDEFVHAIKVSRYKVGFRLILCNGSGSDYYCTIQEIGKDYFTCKVDSLEMNKSELSSKVILYMCSIEKSDLAVQKATELGAHEIHLVNSLYTNSKVQNLDRLRKIAVESAKQCGRAIVPKIFEPISFDEAVQTVSAEVKIIAYECAKEGTIKDVIKDTPKSVAIMVGSEGGFSKEEVALAEKNGFNVVTLGKRILRAETASIVCLALTADLLENV